MGRGAAVRWPKAPSLTLRASQFWAAKRSKFTVQNFRREAAKICPFSAPWKLSWAAKRPLFATGGRENFLQFGHFWRPIGAIQMCHDGLHNKTINELSILLLV